MLARAANHFVVSAPATATAGVAFSFTVTALDPFNNTATGYSGTVHFTSTDGQAVLPADSPLFLAATPGPVPAALPQPGTFSATLNTTGAQTITVTDTVTASLTDTSNPIMVPFNDEPLVAGATPPRAIHITQLRTRIDALRKRIGLSTGGWKDPSLAAGMPILADYVNELQGRLLEAYEQAHVMPPVLSNSPVAPGSTTIQAIDIAQLRSAVVTLEGS